MLLALLGLALFSCVARWALDRLQDELVLGSGSEESSSVDPDNGVYEERLLRPAIEAELARALRFNRQLALVLVGIDELRQRFDYRNEADWAASLDATANLLRTTRVHIDRVYRYGESGFALLLVESGEREVTGLIRRLRRVAKRAEPSEGQPGGPLPIHFGATFFPDCATTADEMIRRAQVALRVAEKSSTRIQLDSAEARALPEPQTLRRPQDGDEVAAAPDSGVSDTAPFLQDHAVVSSKPADEYAPQPPQTAFTRPTLLPEGDPPAGQDEDSIDQALLTARGFGTVRLATASEPAPSSEVLSPLSEGEEAPEGTPGVAAVVPDALSGRALPDESFDEAMKHLEDTLAMIRSLRSRQAA